MNIHFLNVLILRGNTVGSIDIYYAEARGAKTIKADTVPSGPFLPSAS